MTSPRNDQPAPISIDEVMASAISADELQADSSGLYWIESRPAEQGRRTIMCMPDPTRPEQIIDCTPVAKVRSRLHSYGGGAFAVLDGWLAWIDDVTQALWLRTASGAVRQLTESAPDCYLGGLTMTLLEGDCEPTLIAVREEAADLENSVTRLVAISPSDDVLRVIDLPAPWSGADFVACPVLRPDGLLAWTQWHRPAMAWDSSCLLVGKLNFDAIRAYVEDVQLLVGEPRTALDGVGVQRPQWSADGTLRYLSDHTGHYQVHSFNPHTQQRRQLTNEPLDHDLPQWTAENLSYASFSEGDLLATAFQSGRASLRRYHSPEFDAEELLAASAVRAVTAVEETGYALVDYADRPGAIVAINSDETSVLRTFGETPDRGRLAVAEVIWADGPLGRVHAWCYPANTDSPSPLLVMVHGGPTDMRTDAFSSSTQFWTQRGIAVLDVNYAGSSGFGREYRNRLREAWGLADVADVIAVTEQVISQRAIDPSRVAIVGSSAGGFTVLSALIQSDLFAGGIAKYGIADLTKLVGGPKFESRYLDSLIGPWPETEQRYHDRSPLHRADQISSPLLILQGSDDPIVPLAQATAMAKAAEAAGVDVELVIFDGEEHGFRSLAARTEALRKQAEFLGRIFAMDLS